MRTAQSNQCWPQTFVLERHVEGKWTFSLSFRKKHKGQCLCESVSVCVKNLLKWGKSLLYVWWPFENIVNLCITFLWELFPFVLYCQFWNAVLLLVPNIGLKDIDCGNDETMEGKRRSHPPFLTDDLRQTSSGTTIMLMLCCLAPLCHLFHRPRNSPFPSCDALPSPPPFPNGFSKYFHIVLTGPCM